MASSGLREVTKAKMPQSKRAPRNETYKESLLRRIASGDPSFATVAQPPVASKASPSTMRSANSNAPAASQDLQRVLPANNMSSDLKRDAINNPSTAAKSPEIGLKFSKIVSMALLIGPDLKSRVTASSSTKDTAVKISKASDKERSDESTINSETTKKARTSREKRMRDRMAKLGFSDVPRKATPLPISEKQPLKSEIKLLNSWKATNFSDPFRDKSLSKPTNETNYSNCTKNLDFEDVSKKNTPPKISKVNDKKRKSEATTPSKPAKKARKNPPATDPDKSPFQLQANKRNTSNKPDLDDSIDLITPTRHKSSPVLLSIPIKKVRRPRSSKSSFESTSDNLITSKKLDLDNPVTPTTAPRRKSNPIFLSIPMKDPRKPRTSKTSPRSLNASKKSDPNNTVDLITPPSHKSSATFLPKPKTSIFALQNPSSS